MNKKTRDFFTGILKDMGRVMESFTRESTERQTFEFKASHPKIKIVQSKHLCRRPCVPLNSELREASRNVSGH